MNFSPPTDSKYRIGLFYLYLIHVLFEPLWNISPSYLGYIEYG